MSKKNNKDNCNDTINKKTICAKCLKAKHGMIKCLKVKDANIKNLTVKNLITNNLTVNGEFYISSPPITLTVGVGEDFKTPQDALNSLTNRVITSPVTIKIYPGIYPLFNVTEKWFSFENGFSLTIVGDDRNISDIASITPDSPDSSWINGWSLFNSPPLPPITEIIYEYLPNINQTKVYNKPDKIKTNGLIPGDVVVFYNNDQEITPINKSFRFLERTVINVDSEVKDGDTIEFFTVNGNLLSETNNGLAKIGSSVTFLPNVTIESPTGTNEDAGFSITVNTGCTIKGMTCTPLKTLPDDTLYIIGGLEINTNKTVNIDNIVIKDTEWIDITKSGIRFKGFKSQFGVEISNAVTKSSFCILGTCHLVESEIFVPSLPVNIVNSSLTIDDSGNVSTFTLIGSISKNGSSGGPDTPAITLANLNDIRNAAIINVVNPTDQDGNLITATMISNTSDIICNYGFFADCKNGYVMDNSNISLREVPQDNTFYNISNTAVLTKNKTMYGLINDLCNNCNNCYVAEDESSIRVLSNVVIDKYSSVCQSKNNSEITIVQLPKLSNPNPGAVDYCVSDNGTITFSDSIPNPPPVVQCP